MSRALRLLNLIGLSILLLVLAGCASRTGGYYKDDGPGARIPANIASIPDAKPRVEHPAPANLRPYEVFGVRYVPLKENQPYRAEGVASWYGRKFHGERTANGERYDMYAMTAAHPTLPIPSYARVTRVANGRAITVRINDRGPFRPGRIIDLSYAGASKLGLIGPGSDRVIVQAITNNDIRAGRIPGNTAVASRAAATPAPRPATASQSAASSGSSTAPDTVRLALGAGLGPGPVYLQFGAFSSEANAHALARRILLETGSESKVSYQKPLYRVRLGPYRSRSEAEQAASAFTEATGLNTVIALDQDL